MTAPAGWQGRDLWFYRGTQPVLKGLSLNWAPGEKLLLTGSNGAGKSTLIQVVAGSLEALKGTITLAGEPAGRQSWLSFKGSLGLLADRPPLCPGLKVRETLEFWLGLAGKDIGRDALQEALQWAGLGELGERRCTQLSKGQGQRLGLALLYLRRPAWILLDEPQSGLDENGRTLLKELLQGCGSSAVLLCSHEAPPEGLQWDRHLQLMDGVLSP